MKQTRTKDSTLIKQSANAERGSSHFENSQNLDGKSWKSKLKIIINALVFQSENFEDFLERCKQAGLNIEYKPQNKIRLKYRLQGMERWARARARTLGQPYDVEGITERMAKYKAFYNGENLKTPRIKLIDTENERFENNEYLRVWARLKNTRTIAELLLVAERKGCKNLTDLTAKAEAKKSERQSVITSRNELKADIAEYELFAGLVRDYHKYKPFRQERERLKGELFGARKSEKYAEEHTAELQKFNEVLRELNGYDFKNEDGTGNSLPDLKLVETKITRLKNTLAEKENAVKNMSEQIGELTAIKNAFEEYLHTGERSRNRQQELNAERDGTEER